MTSVAILAGGCSFEHEVSLRSARQVVRHLDRRRWQAWPVLLDQDGLWWVPSQPLASDENLDAGFRVPGMRAMRPGAAVEHLLEHAAVRVVFPVLHGEGGEDGTVQGMLELHDLPFVGASCAASAVAMDKLRTRECLTFAGVPMARAFVPRTPLANLTSGELMAGIEAEVGFPCFLKVDCSGSSIGVARAKRTSDVDAFLAQNRARGGRCIVEAQAYGDELTVPVLGNADDRLEPLPPVGIYPRRGDFFDLESKYADGGADEVVPPRGWSDERIARVQDLALRCHQALRCDGMSRTDMIWTEAGPVVLEVNTIPGLTEASLLPKAARAAGYSFTTLVDRLLELALARPRRGAKMQALVTLSIHVHGAGGKMGQMVVAAVGSDSGLSLAGTSGRGDDLARQLRGKRVDVLVEFTHAESAPDHVRAALECGIHVVSGTTGIAAGEVAALAALAERMGRGVVLAPNYALGMVLLQRFAAEAARFFPDVEILELHHEQKRDAPSGTAMATARLLSRVREQARVEPAPRPAEQILAAGARGGLVGGVPVHSIRLPGCLAHQEVMFGGLGQTLTLRHDAYDRRAYWPGIRLAILGVGSRRGLLDSIEPLLNDPRS